ncbi:hypothetical protein BLNAU_21370 [Blattamonas nauphoetae]|uniref:Protein kinase domain-containing protein n=1 Tax=Blattamonas nauphoetae TaxID=2049346 RepID=A0ABQ9WX61_9EUKA|nr:hypothetical protein BLNAU_21370 [Blattamonas nauphoetae]
MMSEISDTLLHLLVFLVRCACRSASPTIIHNTNFTSCSGATEERWVELSESNPTSLDASSWTDTFSLSSPIRGVVVNSPSAVEDQSFNPFSLLYRWHPRPDTSIVVSSTGREDHPLCGHQQMPCLTLDKGIALTDMWSVEIVVEGNVDGVLDVTGRQLTVKGSFGTEILGFCGDGQMRFLSSISSKGHGQSNNRTNLICFQESSPNLCHSESITKKQTPIDSSLRFAFRRNQTYLSNLVVHDNSQSPFSSRIVSTAGVESKATVSDLMIDGSSSSLSESAALFAIGGGSLTLSQCSLKPDTTLVSPLILMSGHTLKITDLTLMNVSFGLNPIMLKSVKTATLQNIELSKCSVSTLLQCEHVEHLSILVSAFTGMTQPFESNDNNLCEWSTGLVRLTNTSCTLRSSSFIDLDDGAIWMDNSTMSIEGAIFNDNTPNDKNKNGTFSFSLDGELFIPCDLKLNVFETGKEANLSSCSIEMSSVNPTKWTETELIFTLSQSSVALNTTHAWRGRLEFGDGMTTSESILVKLSLADERKAQLGNTMKWLGPVIGAVLVLFLLLVIVLVVLHRRRKKQKNKNAAEEKEKNEMNEVMEKIEEVEEFGVGRTTRAIHASEDEKSFVVDTTVSGLTEKGLGDDEPTDKTEAAKPVQVLKMSENVEIVHIPKKNSLFNILHGDNQPLIPKDGMKKQLSCALARLSKTELSKQVFVRLSPHWIFFDSNGTPHFKIGDDVPVPTTPPTSNLSRPRHVSSAQTDSISLTNQAVSNLSIVNADIALSPPDNSHSESFFGRSPAVQAAGRQESMRWRAPEVADNKRLMDVTQCAVFSLGIILWEIETGVVPFGEVDATNASRQLCSGMPLEMEGIKNEEFKTLIQNCLKLNPSERPSLESVAEFFMSQSDDQTQQAVHVEKPH